MYQKIVCPKCGCEYVVSEIFIPQYLLGNPTCISKDDNGKIEAYVGDEQDFEEEYCCDKCNATFKVKANISFDVEVVEEKSFDDEYTSTIYEDRIKLSE